MIDHDSKARKGSSRLFDSIIADDLAVSGSFFPAAGMCACMCLAFFSCACFSHPSLLFTCRLLRVP